MGKTRIRGKDARKLPISPNLETFWQTFREEFLVIGKSGMMMFMESAPREADTLTIMLTNLPAENQITIFMDQDVKNIYLSFIIEFKRKMGYYSRMARGLKPTIKNQIYAAYTKVKMQNLA